MQLTPFNPTLTLMEQTPQLTDTPLRMSGSPPSGSLSENNNLFAKAFSKWLSDQTRVIKKIKKKISSRKEKMENYKTHLAQNTFPADLNFKISNTQVYSTILEIEDQKSRIRNEEQLLFQFKKSLLSARLEWVKDELIRLENQWNEQTSQDYLFKQLAEKFNGISYHEQYRLTSILFTTINNTRKEHTTTPTQESVPMETTENLDVIGLQKEMAQLKSMLKQQSITLNNLVNVPNHNKRSRKHPNGTGPGGEHSNSPHVKQHSYFPSPQPRSDQTRGRNKKSNKEKEKDVQENANREPQKSKKPSSNKKH